MRNIIGDPKDGRAVQDLAEEIFQSTIEASPNAVVLVDEEGRIFVANQQSQRLFGYEKAELLGLGVNDLIPESDRNIHDAYLKEYAERPPSWQMSQDKEIFALRKDGRKVAVEVGVSPVTLNGRSFTMTVLTDVSYRQRTKAALEESNRRFSALMGSLPGMAYRMRFEPELPLEFVSEGCAELTGYGPAELAGETAVWNWMDIIHPEDRPKVRIQIGRSVWKKERHTMRYRILDSEGNVRWVRDQGAGVWNNEGKAIAVEGFVEDITEEKQMQERVVRTMLVTEDLERKRIAKELHDGLQQTLTAALLNLKALRLFMAGMDEKILEKLDFGLSLLDSGIQESREIAHDLLPRHLSESGLAVAIENLITNIGESAKIRIRFQHNIGDERLDLQVEEGLFRIVQETASNIVKHAEANEVFINLVRKTDHTILTVRDDGIGFDPDFVGSESFGLSSIRNRANSMGGEVFVDSRPGGGTTIKVRISPI